MIQLTPQMRILVAIEPADFRKGIDGLTRLCREELNREPITSTSTRHRFAPSSLRSSRWGFSRCGARARRSSSVR